MVREETAIAAPPPMLAKKSPPREPERPFQSVHIRGSSDIKGVDKKKTVLKPMTLRMNGAPQTF